MDPFQSGYTYSFLTLSTGFSFFHSGEKSQWYFGGSARDFNHPYTEWDHANRLQTSYGFQGGCTIIFNPDWQAGTFINLYFQNGPLANTREQWFNCTASRTFNMDDSSSIKCTFGLGIRPADALIPMAGFNYRKNQLMVYYELNAPGLAVTNYHRTAYDISYKLNF
jgi:hypothetical protein